MNHSLSKKTLPLLFALLVSSSLSNLAFAESECVEPNQPIIPDGNIASKNQMIDASKAIKSFQSELGTYRDCLTKESAAIDTIEPTEETAAKKSALLVKHNASVDNEEKIAGDFNIALQAYKKK